MSSVLITGSSSGIGLATALELARAIAAQRPIAAVEFTVMPELVARLARSSPLMAGRTPLDPVSATVLVRRSSEWMAATPFVL